MSVFDRSTAFVAFDRSYRLMLTGQRCVYCGQHGKVLDHVPPLRFAETSPASERRLWRACWSCNGLLGAFPRVCLVERSEFLLAKLRAEWAYVSAGGVSRVSLRKIVSKGRAIKARFGASAPDRLCMCPRCVARRIKPGLVFGQDFGERLTTSTTS